MSLLRHLEASTVFSVLSQVLHSWILTYITSPNLEFDVDQGEIWLIACLINTEGLRAFFPPQTWADVSVLCVHYSCQRLSQRNLMPKKTTGQNLSGTESILCWALLTRFTSKMERPLSLSLLLWLSLSLSLSLPQCNQYSLENLSSLLDSCII